MSSQAPGPEKNSQAEQAASLETPLQAAKAPVEAYNDKNWDRVRALFVEKGVYDEKATGRRIQGIDQIVQASQPKDAEITCEISRCTW